jgi:hypothetical protein
LALADGNKKDVEGKREYGLKSFQAIGSKFFNRNFKININFKGNFNINVSTEN